MFKNICVEISIKAAICKKPVQLKTASNVTEHVQELFDFIVPYFKTFQI